METVFEYLAFAREVTPGTVVTPPTHYVSFGGTIVPVKTHFTPEDRSGTLAAAHRSAQVRRSTVFESEGAADCDFAPFLMQMAVNGTVTAPSTPADGILTRLWTFPRQMTSNGLLTATGYFGDPNNAGTEVWQAPFLMIEEFGVESDASGEDGVMWNISGFGQRENVVASPTLPTRMAGDIPMPAAVQVWIDTSSAIGTTEITSTNTAVVANATCPTGQEPKYTARGPAGGLSYNRRSIVASQPTGLLGFEVDNFDQYDHFDLDTMLKIRIRWNGALIESVGVGPTLYYNYIQCDFHAAKLTELELSENIGNRTHQYQILGHYSASAGTDVTWYAQNQKATV